VNDWIGKQLGQYQITSEIGRGGMAVVYKARQPSLGRYVALKVLPPHLASDQDFVARFRREAMAAAQLNHPHIVTIHDVGQEGDTHFIVMEYLEGQSLFEILRATGPMPLERVVPIVQQVASALDYAHQHGFVHRDIKPANIILRSDDHATLTDFGIAKAMSGTSLTQTGTMIGTPQYMAPEQVQGDNVDQRADVYALAIVCYEMLAGAPPFTGDTAAVLYAQAHKAPPPLRQHLPNLPALIENVLNRALDKEPSGRFSSAGEMANALVLQTASPPPAASTTAPSLPPSWPTVQTPSRPVPATPASPPGAPTTPERPSSGARSWVLLGGGAAVVLILAAVLAFALLGGGGSGQTGRSEDPTRTSPLVPTTAGPSAGTPTPTTPAETASGPIATVSSLPRLAFVIGSPGDANIYLIDDDGANRRRLTREGNDQAEPDWSPDGRLVTYQSDRAGSYDVWVVDADGGNEQRLTVGGVDEREPDWSPDGRQIVYRRAGEPNGDGELWVMDADGRNQRQLGGQAILGRTPVWSPDGRQVAFMSERGDTWNIYLFDLSSGNIRRVSDCSAHCRFPSWSPDGQYILFHSTESASSFTPVKIWRQRADGSGPAELLAEGNNPGRAVWSVEGLVAFNTDDGIEIMNADGSDRHTLPNSDDGWAPDWSR
jgi:serine/threonine protein kinase